MKDNFDKLQMFPYWAGSISFKKSLEIQEKLKASAKESRICFFGFESKTATITMGFRSDKTHILWSEEKLKQKNISTLEIKRGGEATLHSPGQLVIYPVIYLPLLSLKVKDFILALEEITQKCLESFGIKTKKEGKYAGLYTKAGKICFFGIHISEGVSQHGLSINVDNDVNLFESIKSCGETNRQHDSLSFYPDVSINKQDLFLKWCDQAFVFFQNSSRLKGIKKIHKVESSALFSRYGI